MLVDRRWRKPRGRLLEVFSVSLEIKVHALGRCVVRRKSRLTGLASPNDFGVGSSPIWLLHIQLIVPWGRASTSPLMEILMRIVEQLNLKRRVRGVPMPALPFCARMPSMVAVSRRRFPAVTPQQICPTVLASGWAVFLGCGAEKLAGGEWLLHRRLLWAGARPDRWIAVAGSIGLGLQLDSPRHRALSGRIPALSNRWRTLCAWAQSALIHSG